MAEAIYGYAPNKLPAINTANSTAWQLIASDGTGYATISGLHTAGKKCYPREVLPPGCNAQALEVSADNGSGAPASEILIAVNGPTAGSPTAWTIIGSGGGQRFDGPINNVWIKKSVGTDQVYLQVSY